MLADLDRLMRERGLDAVLVPMHEAKHASFRWISRGAKVTRGYAIKRVGHDPVLIAYPMEREEAESSGLRTHLVHDFEYDRIFRTAASVAEAYGEFFDGVLRRLGSGPAIAFFGNVPVHLYLPIAQSMQRRGWIMDRANGEDLIQVARKRKDLREIEAIRSVGRRTRQVVAGAREMLRNGAARTLGELKDFISLEIHRLGMIEDHETIVSQGRDAGIPHSRGDRNAPVRPSVPIVIDIFPADRQSGYFFDYTRTFCLDPIPDPLRAIHADVLAAFRLAAAKMRPGTPARDYQALICDFFELKGYVTTRQDPATLHGYVHSLGHGVGLDIHEKPSFSLLPANHDMVEAGDVLTIEPGLYFPEKEIGVRIEDTFLITEEGAESLCRGEYDLQP
jgi:Xaa-Pro aminopeptidase